MNKMFTAVAILQLVEQGKLSLDATLLSVLPDYPDRQVASKIAIHHLLTHTSGLGNFFTPKFHETSATRYRTVQSHLPLFAGQPLRFEPGKGWFYSNAGFAVLGMVIEKVSGETYQDYVREHIFKPAAMINTDSYNVDDDIPNLALGYTTADDSRQAHPGAKRRTNIFMHVARGDSAGGGYSTVEDLLRFSRAWQKNRLLSAQLTQLMSTGKAKMDRGLDEKYGYGIIDASVNGVRVVGHSGGFWGISSNLDVFPELGYTMIVMSNYDQAAQPVVHKVRELLTGEPQ